MNATRIRCDAGFAKTVVVFRDALVGTEQFQWEAAKRVAVWLVHGRKATEAPLEPSSFSVDDAAFAMNVAVRNFGFFRGSEFDDFNREG